MNAFHIFVAVYCEKCPAKAPCLMKYIATIQKLSNDVGDKAAFYYDEQFRMWRAENPAQMPWEKINAELHMEALQVGLKSRLDGQEKTSKQKSFQQQPFRGKSKQPCFSYNNNNCTRPSCEYAQICTNVLESIPRKTAMNHQSQTKEFMEPPINNRTQPTKSENEVSLNPGVVTPVNVKALEMWLQGYDSAKSEFLLDGFTFGFKIPYCGSRQFRHCTNLQSARENINILQQKIDIEVQKERAAGPFSTSTLPFRNLQNSELFIICLFRRDYQLTMAFQKNFLL